MGIQLIHHVLTYRLTTITEVENLIVPGQDGGRAGRGVDLNELKLDWITNKRSLKQKIIRIDIAFKNAFNSMSQSALGGDESVQHPSRRSTGSHLWENDSVYGS